MERITGPYNGFYIATRTAPNQDRGYLALSKICRGKPDNFVDAWCCASIDPARPFATEQEALADAERRARMQTVELVPYTFARPAQVQQSADAS